MKTTDDLSDETFFRYVTGYATDADRAAVDAWVAGRPDRTRRLQGLLDVIEEWRPRPETVNSEKGWEEMHRKAASAAFPPDRRTLWAPQWRERAAMRWAAAATIVIAIGAGLVRFGAFPSLSSTGHVQTYTTVPAQRATVKLADGSTLTLAPATTVRVSSDVVTVDGEAFFDVAPHAGRVFSVQTTNASIQVLGTRFVVRKYTDDALSRVVVEDGRVSVRARARDDRPATLGAPGRTHVLTERMLAQVSDSGVMVQSGIDPRTYTGLTTGSLVFTSVPLRKVVAELSRAYGTDIRVVDSTLARQPITMTAAFARQPLSQVLDILAQITNAHVTRAGDAFVVVPGRTTTPVEPLQQYRRFPQPEKSYGK